MAAVTYSAASGSLLIPHEVQRSISFHHHTSFRKGHVHCVLFFRVLQFYGVGKRQDSGRSSYVLQQTLMFKSYCSDVVSALLLYKLQF